MTLTLIREQHWMCPNCTVTTVTTSPVPHLPFHTCTGLRGLTAPMVPKGTKCKVEAIEREDYIGKERVQLDPQLRRPVQSIVTTRDNGQDCVVMAPVATGNGSSSIEAGTRMTQH